MSNSNRSLADKRAKNGNQSLQVTTAYEGPLPSPEIMKGFENVLPGSAERILKMAEKEQDNRHTCDRRIVNMHFLATVLGMVFAISSVAIISYLVYLCIENHMDTTASVLGGGSMAAVAGVFIWFRRQKQNK